MTTYYFDVTDIVRYVGTNRTVSGIQRAAIMIIRHIARDLGAGSMRLAYFDDRRHSYVSLPIDRFLNLAGFEMYEVAAALSLPAPTSTRKEANHVLHKYRRGSLKYYFHRARIDWYATRGDEMFFRKRGFSIEEWQRWRGRIAPASQAETLPAQKTEIFADRMKPGDVLCILGALWDNPELDASFREFRDKGLRIHAMVHDTIPLILPDMVHVSPIIFHDWLKASSRYCSGYLANSESTAKDLRHYLDGIGAGDTPIAVTPLAQAPLPPSNGPAPTGDPDDELAAIKARFRRREDIRDITKLPFALSVGTIEARKNCWRMAQAWLQLSREPGLELPRLVFAGKRGWLADDFLGAHDATAGWGGWVQIVEEPSDSDLEYLYRTCCFTVTASLYEGWGLPIGEGLSYGKTGVVSNTSSMPEVGGDMVEYCDPHSIPGIAAACRRLVADADRKAALEARIAKASLRGWTDVSHDIATALQSGTAP